MPELRLQASRDCRALLPGRRRRRCRVSLSLSYSLFVVSVNVNVAALHANSLTLSLWRALSLFAALLVACSAAKSRAAIEGISLPVCRFCRSASFSLSLPPLASLHCPLSYYLCLASRLTLWHDNVTHLS